VLGLFSLSTEQWTESKEDASGLSQAEIERLIEERNDARRKKDWARADAVRQQLAESGIIIEDRPDGTTRVRR
jgi:cysteinyl-tRNA synthetase